MTYVARFQVKRVNGHCDNCHAQLRAEARICPRCRGQVILEVSTTPHPQKSNHRQDPRRREFCVCGGQLEEGGTYCPIGGVPITQD